MRIGRWITWALAVFAILALLITAYIGAYLGLGKTHYVTQGRYVGTELYSEKVLVRAFSYRWQETVFVPLGMAESKLLGRAVEVAPRPPQGYSLD